VICICVVEDSTMAADSMSGQPASPERLPQSRAYRVGSVRIDVAGRVATHEGHVLVLQPKTFELLLVLIQHAGRALSRRELVTTLWPHTFVEEANLSFQVAALRKALGPDARGWIVTLPRYGYRFDAAIALERAHSGTGSMTPGAPEMWW
jgi:DNA-binding winged helix-turn-helix (wHTH) protein